MRGTINHVALTVSDSSASEAAFYRPVPGWLGHEKVEDEPRTLRCNDGARRAVNLWQARGGRSHDRDNPGSNHLAFTAPDRSDVDELHDLLLRAGIDVPAEYPDYGPGYYAAYFADPDGMKFELAHMPIIPD